MTQLQQILYVEDEADIQEVTEATLEVMGDFTGEACSSGKEAVDKAAGFAPELILLDVRMTGMYRPTTFSDLRKIDATSKTPVIFMTAKVQAHEVEHYSELGAVGVISKPYDPETLCDQIEEMWKSADGG